MLHLLTITYQRINKEIILRSYDEESRAFFHEFMKNYPGGFFQIGKNLQMRPF